MVNWLKNLLLAIAVLAGAGAYLMVRTSDFFGYPSDLAGWGLRFLLCCLPLTLYLLGGLLVDAARNRAWSIRPAQGGYFTRARSGATFTAFEDLASLELEDTLKPVGRQMVATARSGQVLARDALQTEAQSRDARAACEAYRAWRSARDPTPPGLGSRCAREGRDLRAWLDAAARALRSHDASESYRSLEFDTETLLETLRSHRSRIEVRAAVAYTLLGLNEPAVDQEVRNAAGRAAPPLVCAAVELARPGEGFVSDDDLAAVRPCLALADRDALAGAPPHATPPRGQQASPRVRLRAPTASEGEVASSAASPEAVELEPQPSEDGNHAGARTRTTA